MAPRRKGDNNSTEFAQAQAEYWRNEAIQKTRLIEKLAAEVKDDIRKAAEWKTKTEERLQRDDRIDAMIEAIMNKATKNESLSQGSAADGAAEGPGAGNPSG